ncbi:MAG: glycerophosphodiester phosphodiesterase [Lachnospiraceae bacterium]|jgi:glycerophosphoryl diester phosphodiesterase|nr:glycerophosphodiester phosphodiesterase [Lachnospiraceae bacterium]MCI1397332.1 glycerophosphodiester phosphodiesterase [Lachnospiraceae bacterium]MCI1423274.1 glycerophosphodiester phosphodiesterase [Lachnospiraceae bacterium]MCI1452138.1 glycerophosphodiester phosphodiesterase [Lachnospiraceae bacterium]
MGKIRIWARRGAAAYEPENTTAAFRKAVLLASDGAVLNVHLSKDGVPVVIHDACLEHVPNGKGYVAERTLSELKRLDVGRTDSIDFMQIPTLEEALKILAPSGMTVNIELMTRFDPYPGLEEKVVALARAYGITDRVVYSSFCHESLMKIREIEPGAKLALLFSDGWYRLFDYAKNTIGASILCIPFEDLRREGFVASAQEAGFSVAVQDAESSEEILACLREKVDIIMSARPDLCRIVIADAV